MTRIEATHRFDVPLERGFAFITTTANWPSYWPGYVRLVDGSRWGHTGDVARLITRLLRRDRELIMTITAYEPDRLVTYSSRQAGLPDASHERHFTADGDGFVYRLVVEYRPRAGFAGLFDRLLLPRAIRRAFSADVCRPRSRAGRTWRVATLGRAPRKPATNAWRFAVVRATREEPGGLRIAGESDPQANGSRISRP